MGKTSGREGTMARIKHIAIRTPDPEKTAAFYKEVFGLQEVGQAGRGYYLSDGHINLAILK
jgi:catechol 2,3-dioxygenase-like lactoylglutathione lyase family enzyme